MVAIRTRHLHNKSEMCYGISQETNTWVQITRLETNINMHYLKKIFVPYRAENTLRLGSTSQAVNVS